MELLPENLTAWRVWALANAYREIEHYKEGDQVKTRPGRLDIKTVLHLVDLYGGGSDTLDRVYALEEDLKTDERRPD